LKATRVILLSNAHKTSVEQAAAEFAWKSPAEIKLHARTIARGDQ